MQTRFWKSVSEKKETIHCFICIMNRTMLALEFENAVRAPMPTAGNNEKIDQLRWLVAEKNTNRCSQCSIL